ncbi:TonB-dependent receptor domain-containing protein [Escherichia coli]
MSTTSTITPPFAILPFRSVKPVPDDGDYRRASNITGASNGSSWTWSRTANTKDVSNKILTNQTNLTSTTLSIPVLFGHDVSTGVEFTREGTNYGVNPVTLPAVNIYHPDSSIHPWRPDAQRRNANGQTDTFAIYAFDTLQITRDFELNGGIRLDNYHTEYDSATACGRGAITCPAGVAKGSPVTTVDTAKSGNLVNWKAGALYHLTEKPNVILTMPFPSSLRAATTSPLRSLAAVTVPTAPILNRKSQHQRDWHQMAGSG